jgi:hydroxymethylpyrimidine pyrophosphatase-like HAD family hydrolase
METKAEMETLKPEIEWNNKVKLIVSDVDETVADLFVPASPEMATELNGLVDEGKSIFLVSGAGFASIKRRVVDLIRPELRKKVLVSHCSGAEVKGFDDAGNELEHPYYSMYDKTLNQEQKDKWREIVKQVTDEFHLEPHPTMPVKQFKEEFGDNPLAVMLEDRRPQITFEFVNAHALTTEQIEKLKGHFPDFDMSDLRIPVMERVGQLLEEADVPITPRLGGMFALDLAIKGVSKTTSVKFALENSEVLSHLGLKPEYIQDSEAIEIWGDKFSVINGGTDRHMSEALPQAVRSIDFRQENPEEFMPGYNTVVWPGNQHLHNGLLEYLQSRPRTSKSTS